MLLHAYHGNAGCAVAATLLEAESYKASLYKLCQLPLFAAFPSRLAGLDRIGSLGGPVLGQNSSRYLKQLQVVETGLAGLVCRAGRTA